jgi:hypothetical protein
MKKLIHIIYLAFIAICFYVNAEAQTADKTTLKIVFIRHGEKPKSGDNLSCEGMNRALQLPKVLHHKFGVPAYNYIPTVGSGKSTSQSRMFQTISPFAIKYNLKLNSSFNEKDSTGVAQDLKTRTGTVLVVWEHTAIAPIVRALGVNNPGLKWPGDDFDSIWIVKIKKGVATFSKDKEGIHPGKDCPF